MIAVTPAKAITPNQTPLRSFRMASAGTTSALCGSQARIRSRISSKPASSAKIVS